MRLSLTGHSPEVVASDQTLVASTKCRIAIILAQLHSLVYPPVAIAEVRRLRITTVETEALRGATHTVN